MSRLSCALLCFTPLVAPGGTTGGLSAQQASSSPPINRPPWVVYRDLEYGRAGSQLLRLDLYLPLAREGTEHWPVVLWFHGQPGSKYPTPARRLVPSGYAVASVEYRSPRAARFPAQLQDAQAALGWIKERGPAYGIDPARVAAWGESAGGHLAALLATVGDSELDGGGAESTTTRVQAAVVYFAPGRRGAASPLRHVSAGDAPMLIVHGSRDRTVSPGRSERLHAALREVGVPSTLELVAGARHDFREVHTARVDSLVHAFLKRHLRGNDSTGPGQAIRSAPRR